MIEKEKKESDGSLKAFTPPESEVAPRLRSAKCDPLERLAEANLRAKAAMAKDLISMGLSIAAVQRVLHIGPDAEEVLRGFSSSALTGGE